jgi:hypothetical protein
MRKRGRQREEGEKRERKILLREIKLAPLQWWQSAG